MSGKGAGKKRNRAAQSEQHGYQERPGEIAGKPEAEETRGSGLGKRLSEKQRVIDKLHDLEKRRREKAEGQD